MLIWLEYSLLFVVPDIPKDEFVSTYQAAKVHTLKVKVKVHTLDIAP